MGDDAQKRHATDKEIAEMCDLLQQSIEAGAFGPQGGNVFLFETPIVLADVPQGAPDAMFLIAINRAAEIPANDLFHSRIVIAVAI